MRAWIYAGIVALLFLPATVCAQFIWGGFSAGGSVQTTTTAALSLYVDAATGNDGNPCTLALPCITIQAAFNKVPRYVRHQVRVYISAGTFAGATLVGQSIESNVYPTTGAGISISGTRINATLTTGPVTGTVTSATQGSGSTFGTLTVTGAGWTVNELAGKMLEITGGLAVGNITIIDSNTADVISIVGIFSPSTPNATSTFAIRDWGTVINTAAAYGPGAGGAVSLASTCALIMDEIVDSSPNITGIQITDLKATVTFPLCLRSSAVTTISRVSSNSANASLARLWNRTPGVFFFADTCNVTATGTAGLILDLQANGPTRSTVAGTRFEFPASAVIGALNISGAAAWVSLTRCSLNGLSKGLFTTTMQTTAGTHLRFQTSRFTIASPSQPLFYLLSGVSSLTFPQTYVWLNDVVVNGATSGVVSADGPVVIDASKVTGSGNGTVWNLNSGATLITETTTTATGTAELSLDGATYSYATLRALSPKVIANIGTGSKVINR